MLGMMMKEQIKKLKFVTNAVTTINNFEMKISVLSTLFHYVALKQHNYIP